MPHTPPLHRSRRLALVLSALGAFAPVAHADPARSDWQQRYEHARRALLEHRAAEAAREFEVLARESSNPQDRRLASEFESLARAEAEENAPKPEPHLRTSDELTLLYSTAFVYGLGSSAWVALVTQPKNLGGAVLPFAALTTAAVGGVALVDDYRPFRRGVPQSISAGLYLGLGEGVWAVGIQHAYASRRAGRRRWGAETVATVLWTGTTLGGAGGALVGGLREPTPGRVSFTASSSVWGGLMASFVTAGIDPHASSRTENAFLAGAIGYNVGLASGIAFAPAIAPSVARVRFVDLGAIGGGLLGAGAYGLAAGDSAKTRFSFGASGLGIALGLAITWWATADMPGDDSSGSARVLPVPSLSRTRDGWLASLSGAF